LREVETPRRDLLRQAGAALRRAGITAPEREARWLAEAVWGVGSAALLGEERLLGPGQIERYWNTVARRLAGEPLAYVTGQAAFRHLMLRSDRRALIPRPETEGLVDLALTRVPVGRALDIGTGTGAIALSLAAEGGYHDVVATDRSPDALALARENRSVTGLRIALVLDDLGSSLRQASFDVLVSNPPYLSAAEGATLDRSVRDWEPAEALVSGSDGLAATRRLLVEGHRLLRPGGWIVIELECSRAGRSAELASAHGWLDVAVLDDLFNRARYLVARRSDSP